MAMSSAMNINCNNNNVIKEFGNAKVSFKRHN